MSKREKKDNTALKALAKAASMQQDSKENAGQHVAVNLPKAPKSLVQLLPYQARWVEDNSPLKVVVKARQTGYSFSSTIRAVLKCLERRTTWIFLSKGERQSRMLMEKVQEHIQSCGLIGHVNESQFFEGTLIKQLEVRFPNGSVIYGLPANPDTARGYTGNVTLDEFAFHADAEKIYTALYPITTRGYGLEVISTPNGQQGKYFEIAKGAGLADGLRSKDNRWSAHKTSVYEAAKQGLKVDIDQLRSGVDEETWRQEFCCEFLTAASEWISPELFQSCVSSEASADLGSRRQVAGPKSESFYAGWDIARNRDLSVIWLNELVGDVTWTRGVIEMRNLPTPDQVREAKALLPWIRRINIDQSGMGLAIAEQLERDYPGKVEGVQFTQPKKEALAVFARRRMEEMKVRIPDDEGVRASFRAVKKTQNAIGQTRFDTEHDAKLGHADHWWAFCLAEAAAQQTTYHLAGIGGVIGKPAMAGFRGAVL